MAITSGTAINLPVNLEIMQGSLNDLQKVLNKLEPDSAPFKSLSRIILEMTRGMEKFQVQTSKSFTSQRQFDQAQKTVEKLEESLTRAQLAISRIKFSDIKLDAKQSAAFNGFEKELDNIEKKLDKVKEKVKNDIFSDDVTKSQLSLIDKQGLNKSFDEIEKIVERRTQTIKAEIEGYKAQLSLLDERVAKGTRAQSLLNKGITNDIFGGQYTYEKNGNTYFKSGEAKSKFLNALQEEFSLTNEEKEILKNLTLGQMNDLFKQMGEGQVPNIFEQWTKSLDADGNAQARLNEKIQKAQELQDAVLALKQKLSAAQGDGTPLSLGMEQYNDDVKRVAAAIAALEAETLNGVRANDQYKNSFNSMSGQLNSFTNQLNNANAEFLRLQQQQQTFNSIKTAIVNFMGFNQVLNLTKTAVREAMNHIKELDTTMNGIAIVTDMTTADLWNQIDAYSEMAQRYGTTIQGAYEVSKIYYQAGYETNDVLTLMNETLKLSKISGLDYATTTDYMMTATRGFHMEVSEAANVVDVYSALAAHTAVSQQELAEAMSKTASSMEGVGSTFQEASAMIATTVAVTRESAMNIGSAMKSIASRFGELTKNPTKLLDAEGEAMSFNKVDEALKSVGITLQTTDHQFRSFTDVILELTEVWDKLDSAQQRYQFNI